MDNTPNNSEADADPRIPVERAQSPWMIGLLVMIFGILGMSVSAMNLYLTISNLGNVRSEYASVGMDLSFVYFSLTVGLLIGVWMTYIGARLLAYKDDGRRHFNYYIIFFVIWTLGTTFYQYMTVPEGFARQVILNGMLPELIGKAAMLLLFLGCRYLLNKSETRRWLN
ncbi:MAG: hypothetical protein R3F02_01160 [Thiolinea sp.]